MKIFVLVVAAAFLSVCDRPPTGEADHSKHDHTRITHGVMDRSKMESSPGSAEAPRALQFIDTMIAHHQGAVDMALLANTRTQRDEMKKLAKGILDEQRRAIADMQAWRTKRFGEAKPALNMEFPGMRTGMSGMDLVKLAGLKGDDFDVAFIRQMITHHTGAIEMAKALNADDSHGELADLATFIIASRSSEIERMKMMDGNLFSDAK